MTRINHVALNNPFLNQVTGFQKAGHDPRITGARNRAETRTGSNSVIHDFSARNINDYHKSLFAAQLPGSNTAFKAPVNAYSTGRVLDTMA